jgi:hypothetical protein
MDNIVIIEVVVKYDLKVVHSLLLQVYLHLNPREIISILFQMMCNKI